MHNFNNKNKKNNTIVTTAVMFVVSAILVSGFLAGMGLIAQQQTAEATHGSADPNKTVFMWHDGICASATECNTIRDKTNAKNPESSDKLIMHMGNPSQAAFDNAVNAMKGVTGISAANKGFEFIDADDAIAWADNIAAEGFDILAYNLEDNRPNQADEWATPVTSHDRVRDAAVANGLKFWAAPAKSLLESGSAWDDIVGMAWWVHYQSQAYQDDDTTCAIMDSKVANMVTKIEGFQAAQEGEISYQVTTSQDPAPGKTIRQTVTACMNRISGDDVDGVMVWSNQASLDNGDLEAAWAYHEAHFSTQ
jgi:hypothetical protein